MSLQELQKNVEQTLDSIPQKDVTIEGEFLAIHGSIDNLWSAIREHKEIDKQKEKLANIFICSLITASKLGINNLDDVIKDRLNKIRTAPYRGDLQK